MRSPLRARCRGLPEGAAGRQPRAGGDRLLATTAAIYLDGEYIGETPLRYPLSYTSLTGSLTLVAEPLYPPKRGRNASCGCRRSPGASSST